MTVARKSLGASTDSSTMVKIWIDAYINCCTREIDRLIGDDVSLHNRELRRAVEEWRSRVRAAEHMLSILNLRERGPRL